MYVYHHFCYFSTNTNPKWLAVWVDNQICTTLMQRFRASELYRQKLAQIGFCFNHYFLISVFPLLLKVFIFTPLLSFTISSQIHATFIRLKYKLLASTSQPNNCLWSTSHWTVQSDTISIKSIFGHFISRFEYL